MQTNLVKNNNQAFTIIEALIGISILTIAIVAPLQLATNALYSIKLTSEQIVASQLAQEGVEIVRFIRDRAVIKLLNQPTAARNSWLADLGVSRTFDTRTASADVVRIWQLEDCTSLQSDCAQIYKLNDFYRAGAFLTSAEKASANKTRFKRLITLKYKNDNLVELRSEVRWKSGISNKERSIIINTMLHNYLPERN